jgi:hypothetical protein
MESLFEIKIQTGYFSLRMNLLKMLETPDIKEKI